MVAAKAGATQPLFSVTLALGANIALPASVAEELGNRSLWDAKNGLFAHTYERRGHWQVIDRVRKPSEVVHMGDATNWLISQSSSLGLEHLRFQEPADLSGISSVQRGLAYRHGGPSSQTATAAVLYFDGHAGLISHAVAAGNWEVWDPFDETP
jgi:hypothetical protein